MVTSVVTILQGSLTPHKLALTIALGVTIGIFPFLWGASLLCIVIAWVFRLNQVCLQAVNFLAWPLQLALLVPFFHLGERLLSGWQPRVLDTGITQFLARLGPATVKALTAWFMVAPFLSLFLYLVLVRIISRYALLQKFTSSPQ